MKDMTEMEVTISVCETLADYLQVPVQPIHRLDEDLDMDSMDRVDIWMRLEEVFDIEIEDDKAAKFVTVQDIIEYIEALP